MGSKRSRQGCQTCRKRHQKCDENKPACWNCQIRGVVCGGYNIQLAEFTSQGNRQGQMVSRLQRGSVEDESQAGPMLPMVRSVGTTLPRKHSIKQSGIPIIPSNVAASLRNGSDACALTENSDGALPPPRPRTASRSDDEMFCQLDFGTIGIACSGSEFDPTMFGHEPRSIQNSNSAHMQQQQDYPTHEADSSAQQGLADNIPPIHDPESDLQASSIQFGREKSSDQPLIEHTQKSTEGVELGENFTPNSTKRFRTDTGDESDTTIDSIVQRSLHTTSLEPFDQYLLAHYVDDLALRLYPVKIDQNPYRFVYANLATKSQALEKAIYFGSALHMVKLGKLPGFSVQPYRQAMQDSFRDALHVKDDAWGLAATVLLSVVFDFIGTGLESWSAKLIGCGQLLELALSKSQGQPTPAMRCIVLQYNWGATMGRALLKDSLSAETLDALHHIDIDLDGPIANQDMIDSQAYWWGNLPDYQMHLMLREATNISIEIQRLKACGDRIDDILRRMASAAELVTELNTWQPDVSRVDLDYAESVKGFNEVWKQGILCYIYHEIYLLESTDYRIQNCVLASLRPFTSLRWLQACLFPTFMIAVHARTEASRNCFKTGILKMHTSLAFQAPLSILLTLKNIWEHADRQTSNGVRWREITKSLGVELNILL